MERRKGEGEEGDGTRKTRKCHGRIKDKKDEIMKSENECSRKNKKYNTRREKQRRKTKRTTITRTRREKGEGRREKGRRRRTAEEKGR